MKAVTPIIIRVASRDLGWNRSLPEGFELGTLPVGGYGVKWRSRGARGLGSWTYWVPWEPPQDPIRIEFDGQVYILCQEGASEAEIRDARRGEYASEQEVR
jgi:hypothetical protein